MTAPVEPPQASSDGAVAESNDLVIGGNRIPLPRWARFLVGILAILVAAVPLLNIFGVPVTQLASVISKPTPSPTVTSTPTPAPVSDSGHKLSDAQMFNYRESDRHANETARTDKIIFDSRDLGTLRVKFFISDRCLQVIRKSAGDNPLTISQYIPATKMEDQAPGPLGAQAWLPQDTTVDRDLLDSQLEPASFAPEGEAATPPTGNCWDPHGGEFRWWNGQQNGCWLQIWRAWPDGCQHYQWFNSCNGYWDSNQNGTPRVYWSNCNH